MQTRIKKLNTEYLNTSASRGALSFEGRGKNEELRGKNEEGRGKRGKREEGRCGGVSCRAVPRREGGSARARDGCGSAHRQLLTPN